MDSDEESFSDGSRGENLLLKKISVTLLISSLNNQYAYFKMDADSGLRQTKLIIVVNHIKDISAKTKYMN